MSAFRPGGYAAERPGFMVSFHRGRAFYANWAGEARSEAEAIALAKGDVAAVWDAGTKARGSDAGFPVEDLTTKTARYGFGEGFVSLAVTLGHAMRKDLKAFGTARKKAVDLEDLREIAARDPKVLAAIFESEPILFYKSSLSSDGSLAAKAELSYPSVEDAVTFQPGRGTLLALVIALVEAEGAYPRTDGDEVQQMLVAPESATLRAALKARQLKGMCLKAA